MKYGSTCILCGVVYDIEYMRQLLSTHTAREIANLLPNITDLNYPRALAKRLRVDMPKAKVLKTDQAIEANKGDTLCWRCANATDSSKCIWVKNFTPIEGWDAVPRKIKYCGTIIDSYNVRACPNFKEG